MVAAIVIGVTVLVALFILGGAAWFAFDSDKRVRKFARSTDLIPGRPGRAPQEWTTSTSLEARLHRRIRYAIADVHQNPAIPHDQGLMAERDRLDSAVFDLDDKLIAAAELPDDDKSVELERIESAIKQLEELPKKLWEAPADQQRTDIDDVIASIARV
ncbi:MULTISPECIES: hypothetical protein [unclassified Gordonia (in: high G+C Gram-positive bacteria)]